MTRSHTTRAALTLMEVIAVLIIAATVAAISLQYLRPPGEMSKQRSCDLTRQLLQGDAVRYEDATGTPPSADLRELQNVQYSGLVLPVCPVTGDDYRRDRNGTVGCPTHEPTRAK